MKFYKFIISGFLLSIFLTNVYAQDTVNLKSLKIYPKDNSQFFDETFRIVKIFDNNEITFSPNYTFSELLSFNAGIDIQKRGVDDIQADINILGGNFEQNLILINGFKNNNPQTGHFNLNLPVSAFGISQIEVLDGSDANLYGVNAFSGAINFVSDFKNSFIQTNSVLGQNRYMLYNFLVNIDENKQKNFFFFEHSSSAGYIEDTDFETYKGFWFGKKNTDKLIFKYQFGILWKNFGAYKFYTSKFPYQFEHNNSELADFSLKFKKINLYTALSFRRTQDRFELFREGENWYVFNDGFFIRGNDTAFLAPNVPYTHHNYHSTNSLDFLIEQKLQFKNFKIYLTSEFFFSRLHSTVMGDPLDKQIEIPFENDKFFTKYADYKYYLFSVKNYFDFFGTKNLAYFSLINFNGWNYGYGFNNQIEINKNLKINNIINYGTRFPSLTEMYYQDPVHQGNPNLKNEENLTFESNLKFINAKTAFQSGIFYRKNKNLIGWIYDENNAVFKTMNFGKYDLIGFDLNFKKVIQKFTFKEISVNYTFLKKLDNYDNYILYLSDYPKHNLTLVAVNNIKNFYFSYSFLLKDREVFSQNYDENYKFYTLFNIQLLLKLTKGDIFILCENVFNEKYYDFGYTDLPMPGRWFKVGIKYNLYEKNKK